MRREKTQGPVMFGLAFACLLLALPAQAASLDLSNAQQRWVAVAFEVSPPERPAQLQTRYTQRMLAQLEPGPRPGELQVRVAGDLVERFILTGHSPKPGSFGDFVWIFDAGSGHVRAAELRGAVERKVGWGFASWTATAQIEVRMSTHAAVAFRTAELVGEAVHHICPQPNTAECTRMTPAALDPHTGYVNAVGSIRADSGPLQVESFSPLGEAIFTEIEDTSDALYSATLERPIDLPARAASGEPTATN